MYPEYRCHGFPLADGIQKRIKQMSVFGQKHLLSESLVFEKQTRTVPKGGEGVVVEEIRFGSGAISIRQSNAGKSSTKLLRSSMGMLLLVFFVFFGFCCGAMWIPREGMVITPIETRRSTGASPVP